MAQREADEAEMKAMTERIQELDKEIVMAQTDLALLTKHTFTLLNICSIHNHSKYYSLSYSLGLI